MTSQLRPSQVTGDTAERVRAHLDALYPPDAAAEAHDQLLQLLERFMAAHRRPRSAEPLFDHRDVVLITYADQITQDGEAPLRTLREFLVQHVGGAINGVHLLPFYPATSDGGFSVVDYCRVDPTLGSWEDVTALAGDFKLMVDAVFNHVSASSPWFRAWAADDRAFDGFFLDVDPGLDLSSVTRPRASPLLTTVECPDGARHVWTTFSADQIDLNYRNPAVLVAVTEALLHYLGWGARIIRLDAVAFLWKSVGTSCLHLPQTHEIIRLWRTIVDAVAPGTLLITETNVPHEENVSYFGNGYDEAHLVYQFPLAPLLLSAFHLADSTVLSEWASSLAVPSPHTAFFNFLGSHDGVGLRPAEGLLTRSEINQLCELAKAHGAGVSYRATPDGHLSPYELNTVYFDALTEVDSKEPLDIQIERFLAAQSILLALAGVPAIYVQALLGSRNWHDGVRETGNLRAINRQKFARADIERELADPRSLRAQVLTRFRERIRIRVSEPSFHPNGHQRILAGNHALFVIERIAPDSSRAVLCIHNLSGRWQAFDDDLSEVMAGRDLVDLCSGRVIRPRRGRGRRLEVDVPPYAVLWLRALA